MAIIDLINGILLVGFRYQSIIGRLRYVVPSIFVNFKLQRGYETLLTAAVILTCIETPIHLTKQHFKKTLGISTF